MSRLSLPEKKIKNRSKPVRKRIRLTWLNVGLMPRAVERLIGHSFVKEVKGISTSMPTDISIPK
jgi:hypothetical protein